MRSASITACKISAGLAFAFAASQPIVSGVAPRALLLTAMRASWRRGVRDQVERRLPFPRETADFRDAVERTRGVRRRARFAEVSREADHGLGLQEARQL